MKSSLDVLKLVSEGYQGISQTGNPSYHKRGCPMNGVITDDMDEEMRGRFIRAMIYPPYALAKYNGKELASWMEYVACKQNNQTQEN